VTKIIGGIDVDRTYTGDEVLEMNNKGHLRNVTLKGYCTRVEHDGTIKFVPYWDSTWFRQEQDKAVSVDVDIATPMLEDLKENHPIIRRTPQERVASMMLRLMGEYRRTGSLPGIPTDLIKKIVGNSWREGMPLTEEVVRAVAAHYLGLGEQENKRESHDYAIKDRVPSVDRVAAATPRDSGQTESKERNSGDTARGKGSAVGGVQEGRQSPQVSVGVDLG
jgi:hypothetical protein